MDQFKHAESGASLMKDLANPNVRTFGECFDSFEEWRLFDKKYKPTIEPVWITGRAIATELYDDVKAIFRGERRNRHHPERSMSVGPFCSRRDGGSMAVKCSPWVIDAIKAKTIIVPHDRMSFEIVDHDNGWSLVIAQHSQICGNVWLAYIRTETIPSFKTAAA